jgi:pathogenesis-related protein 1
MEKSPAGALRAVVLILCTAGCAEVVGVLADSDATAPPRPVERAADSPPARPVAQERAAAGEPPSVAGITAAHNKVRASVGVPSLRWSPALAQVAKRWANACVDVAPPRGMIDHSPGRAEGFPGPLGENLYATTDPVASPAQATGGWAAEARHYDHARNACTGGMCGHYTQMVWRTTREVGCAVGSCPRLQYRSTLVCNYFPAGNIVGQRPW